MRHSFARAAAEYDGLAVLQRQIGERLLGHLPEASDSGWMVDVGAGTGWCAQQLARRYPDRPLLVLDIAEGMLQQARMRCFPGQASFVAGDAEMLPLASGSAGLLISNLALQWCLDPLGALTEMARVLQPGGCLLLTTFVSGTLEELRQAWSQVDEYTHVNDFQTPQRLEAYFPAAGYREWRMTEQRLRLGYDSLVGLFLDLKGIGAHNVTTRRPRQLMGKGRLRRLETVYPRQAGRLLATFVPAYIVAVK